MNKVYVACVISTTPFYLSHFMEVNDSSKTIKLFKSSRNGCFEKSLGSSRHKFDSISHDSKFLFMRNEKKNGVKILSLEDGSRVGEIKNLHKGTLNCIIASKGGAPSHPAWFLNLEANPSVQVQVATQKFDAVARVAQGAERERLWNLLVDYYAPYTDYQAATERQIPVVVLDPV